MPSHRACACQPEQPAFIVIEIEQIEADAAVDRRGDLKLPAAMREGPQCRFEERPADSVEDDLRSLTLSQTAGG